MAHIVNPYNLDDDDDAVFSALLSQGLIWVEEDDEDDSDASEVEVLESISEGKTRTLNGHTNSVNKIVVSGDFAISASSDNTLCVWNWKTGQHLRTLNGHTNSVNDAVMSGDFAISASSDNTLRVWNWKTGQHLRTLEGLTQTLALGDHFVFTAADGDIRIWNWQTGEPLQKLGGWHRSPIIDLAVDGDLLLSVSPDVLLVRNWRTGQNIHKLNVQDDIVYELENLALNNDFAVFIDYDRIDAWNWKTGEFLDKAELRSESHSRIAYRLFSTPSASCIYDAKTNKWYLHMFDDDRDYNAVAFADDYSHIIRGNSAGVIHVARVVSLLQRLLVGKTITERQSPRTSHKTVEPTPEYDTDDVLEAARDCIRKRNEKWVNFTHVSQYLHKTFHNLDLKTLGRSDKNYTSLLKLIADYPSDFELRQDTQKQGLYWIRLKQKR